MVVVPNKFEGRNVRQTGDTRQRIVHKPSEKRSELGHTRMTEIRVGVACRSMYEDQVRLGLRSDRIG